MTNPSLRLTFLYPHLFRTLRASEPAAQTARQCCRYSTTSQRVGFATTTRRRQRFAERHGKAVEPFLVPGETKEDVRVFVPETTPAAVVKKDKTNASAVGEGEAGDGEGKIIDENEASPLAPLSEETQAAARIPGDLETGSQETAPVDQASASQSTVFSTTETGPPRDGPLEKILEMEKPSEETANGLNIPHLHPPPYVHNFDSYTLVKEVEKGGFTPEQAITAMKAVRMLLANNLEVAKTGLVSKSDVENVSFVMEPSDPGSRNGKICADRT
jgi:hypothetical protein